MYLWFRSYRDSLFEPLALALLGWGLKPNHISLVGVLFAFPFVIFFKFNPWLSGICLLLSIILDSIDGLMARLSRTKNRGGAFIDFASDYFIYFVVFFTMLWYGLLNNFWASLHVLNYVILQFLVIYTNYLKIEIFPVIRSKFIIFFFFYLWLFSGLNYFDGLLFMLTIYMMITNFFIFIKIKWSLSS